MAKLIGQNTEDSNAQIAYSDAGSPAYRWMDLISNRLLAGTPTTAFAHRVYTYVSMAMYNATIAAWESKYFYNRARPSELDHHLPTAVDVPDSPSYPSNTPQRRRPQPRCWRPFSRTRRRAFRTWLIRRRSGVAAFSFRVTSRLVPRSGRKWPSR